MSDPGARAKPESPDALDATPTLDCDLLIVGAGYAALNGLNAAAKYLRPGARVVIVDKKDGWGGQWLHQYDFVRLHQPYRMFTAGDQPWTLRRDPSHLATRREVLDHLGSVSAVSAGHLEVEPLFGHTYVGHRMREGRVEVDLERVATRDGENPKVRVRARRLLKATGVDIEILRPLPLSSTRVRSVAVADALLTSPDFLAGRDPVYVVGGGKTAMDCIRHLALADPGKRRALHIIPGSGMWFFTRDTLYPTGLKRFTSGSLTADIFRRIAQEFDGTNERAVMEALREDGLVMNVFGEAGNCRYGLLSYAERDEIGAALAEVHRGHLVDVDGTTMTLRDAAGTKRVEVPEGSVFVNCTSHLRQLPWEPVLQDGGAVCAPQFALGFTGTTAYYLTHLWYRDGLAAIAPELYRSRIDVEPKLRFAAQVAVMVMANFALVAPRLPLSVPSRFLGDFNKWYPLFRQIPMIVRMNASRGEMLRKADRVLKMRFSDSPEPS